jgi:hypothetical protein
MMVIKNKNTVTGLAWTRFILPIGLGYGVEKLRN